MIDRRAFIGSLAAIAPAGAFAAKVEAETDPVLAAFHLLMGVLKETAPSGYEVHGAVTIIDGNIVAMAFPPDFKHSDASAVYDQKAKRWRIESPTGARG